MRLATLAAIALGTSACVFNFGDVSDKEMDTQPRAIETFDAIELEGSVDIDVAVEDGAEPKLEVEAASKVIDDIETTVEGGTLHVRLRGRMHVNTGRMLVRVTVPSLRSLELSGSGDALVKGLDEESFAVAISGSGDAELGGEAEAVTASVTGSGDIGARGLEAQTASVTVRGSGDVVVTASESATGSIAGSGDITVLGGAECTIAVSGSGDVNC